ncbi:MAG: flagellar basal body-associated FliL family protein [Deltaproteobacteria bacterium]|nr:flagellar basal body-associated FliL family protein [Deltaproteobacteria bacterium]
MKKKPVVLIGIAAAALLLLAGAGFFGYRAFFAAPKAESGAEGKKEPGKEKEAEKGKGEEKKGAEKGDGKEGAHTASAAPGMGPTASLEPFVVNLADPGRPRYAKIVVQLELDAEPAAGEIEGLKPKVRDSLIMLFSSKTSEEMITVGGKETLRNEIIRRLNALLTTGKVAEVYFTEFVVQ